MVGFALLGAGRIGKMHASFIAAHPQAQLLYVYDLYPEAAARVSEQHGCLVAGDVAEVFANPGVQAVLIASNTDTHVELLTQAVTSGKAVFCEKPISLDLDLVKACREEIKDCPQPVQIGFNRRFDPSHKALRDAVAAGDIGDLEQLIITSRDPGLPPVEYIKASGGIFMDMLIHDFDMARYILGEEIVEIQATGSALVDPGLTELNDIDSAMVVMKTASGKLCHINASRRAVYGYDQRIEALGSKGMLQSNNPLSNTLSRFDAQATHSQRPLHDFFIERYEQAYRDQMNSFIDALLTGTPVSPSFEDGHQAQVLADAARQAFLSGEVAPIKKARIFHQ